MKNKDILNRINSEMNNIIVPDVLSKVRDNSVINIKAVNKKARTNYTRKIAFAVSMIVILLAVFIPLQVFVFSFDTAVAATITIDVNPEVQLQINSDDQIISATGINDDGIDLLSNIKLKRKSIDDAIEIIMTRMDELNYENTSILYDLNCNNESAKGRLKNKINENTNNYYQRKGSQGDITWRDEIEAQTDNLEEIQQNANQYGISTAKMTMINRIIEEHPEYTIAELSTMSIGELRRIQKNG